ncbi:MAG: hypothetical protein ACR2JY_19995 [Chloroflexota bacterium]
MSRGRATRRGAPVAGKAEERNPERAHATIATKTFTTQLPFCPAATEGVVVAYVSDGTTHGAALGDIGINLHNQLAGHLVAATATPQAMPQAGGGGLARLPQEALLAVAALLGLGAATVRARGRRIR